MNTHPDLERALNCQILAWAEPTDDGERFVALQRGVYIEADSEALLLLALTPQSPPYALAA